jgi:hypothetical protein
MTDTQQTATDKAREVFKKKREMYGTPYTHVTRELAKRGVEIPPLGLKRLERGQRRLEVDELIGLCAVLNIPLTDIFGTMGVPD